MVRVLLFVCFFIPVFSYLSLLSAGQLSHQAYVWQRNWSPRLTAAIERHAVELEGLTVLVTEISPSADGGAVVHVPVDFDVLRATNRPITLAIRVGNYSGPFDMGQPMTKRLLHEVRAALDAALAGAVVPAAVEIDFDCATSKLEGYAEWLRALRSELGEVPLSITTLPTWMNRPQAFGELVRLTDHFVLQVHSVKRPDSIESEVMLCNPADARRWTREAAVFCVPYHVALPTYGYRLAFNAAGALVEVSGEDASSIQNPDWRYRVIWAEPKAMAGLVVEMGAAPLENFNGMIWYRLPIGRERLNWDALTWRAVMSGQVEQSGWAVQAVAQDGGAIELRLRQNGNSAQPPPQQVTVQWAGATALAWDGQRNYSAQAERDHSLVWRWPDAMPMPMLKPDTEWIIGWLRLDADAELNISTQ